MNRKLVQQGGQAYTVTLPISWIRENGLSAGDDISLALKENKIIITGKEKTKTGTAHINISDGTKRLHYVTLLSAYARGVDNLTIKYSESFTVDQAMGYAILEDAKNVIQIKDISGTNIDNLDEIFKRVFQMILQFAKDAVTDITGKQEKDISYIHARDAEINKFCLYLQRAIIKNAYEDPTLGKIIFAYAFTLEQIGDEINRLWRAQEKKTQSSEIKNAGKLCIEGLENAFAIYYRGTTTLYNKQYTIKDAIRNIKTKDAHVTIALMRMVKIVETVSDLTQLAIMKDIKIK